MIEMRIEEAGDHGEHWAVNGERGGWEERKGGSRGRGRERKKTIWLIEHVLFACSIFDAQCSMLDSGFSMLNTRCSMLYRYTSASINNDDASASLGIKKSNLFFHSRETEIPPSTCMDMQCYPTERAAAQIGRGRETRVVNISQRLSDVPRCQYLNNVN